MAGPSRQNQNNVTRDRVDLDISVEPGVHEFYETNVCFEEGHEPYLSALRWIVEKEAKLKESNVILFERIRDLQGDIKNKEGESQLLQKLAAEKDEIIEKLTKQLEEAKKLKESKMNRVILSSTQNVRRVNSGSGCDRATDLSSIQREENYTIPTQGSISLSSQELESDFDEGTGSQISQSSTRNGSSCVSKSLFSTQCMSSSHLGRSVSITFGHLRGNPETQVQTRSQGNQLQDSKTSYVSISANSAGADQDSSVLESNTDDDDSDIEMSLPPNADEVSEAEEADSSDENNITFKEPEPVNVVENQRSLECLLDRTSATLMSTLSSESILSWEDFRLKNNNDSTFKIIRVEVQYGKRKLPCKHLVAKVKEEATYFTRTRREKLYRVCYYQRKEQRIDGNLRVIFVEPPLSKNYVCEVQDVAFHLQSPVVLRRGALFFNDLDVTKFNIPLY